MYKKEKIVTADEKEVSDMNTNAMSCRRLDFSKINNRIVGNISSEEALKNVTPIQWSDDIVSGKRKVIITKDKGME